MQRQSLGGSPASKLHQTHGGPNDQTLTVVDSPNRNKDLSVFSTTASSSSSSSISAAYQDDEDHKASKPHRLSSPPPIAPHKSIHVIPVLTLLCFLILFLFSHIPSQSDLAQFNGFTKLPGSAKRVVSADSEIDDIGRFIDIRKSDVLAIRSLRNLQDTQTQKLVPRSRSHRKIADF
ncbi:unnamed protein product [Malus baccata var. baccata]|uniref:Uncharacterized protein n=1 Tax=Malus baccata TaxID=106549 RepID=A0A540K5F9_MALBA|nr:hypothetical protein C1H46_045030 [Malus baccata]